ncbi:MAG TPA: transposase [Candidatus Xenobia bacterium]|jgi:esterase/lipase superfamily enzyme
MHTLSERWFSPALDQDMSLNIYGHGGQPILILPAQEGNHREYEGFGMVDAVIPFIEMGRIQLYCVDSVDAQSWCNNAIPVRDRARRHVQYERYLIDEVVPMMGGRPWVSGCSMGGYQSANFYFRHPDVASGLIALSGVYDLTLFIGDAMDEDVFLQVPLAYLPGLNDDWYLSRYRQGRIVICVGQGAWEEPMLTHTRQMRHILEAKGIPAWVDIWGHDVNHDWPWWRVMMPFFVEKLLASSG